MTGDVSRQFWDRAATENAAWYVATGHTAETDEFFRHGAEETDALLAFCQLTVAATDTVVEIGCGVGRMTRRLSELAARVIAVDVSEEMLRRGRENLADRANVELLKVPGDGHLPDIADGAANLVFSYITLQHVPSREAQLLYLKEASRVLAPGGRLAVQVRGAGVAATSLDWFGHLYHLARGRATMSRAWRGARLTDREIIQTCASSGVVAGTTRSDRRHRWVVGHRP
jgi:SAM-dependent methyltransferase